MPFGDSFLSVRLGAQALELAKSEYKSQLCYPLTIYDVISPSLNFLICEMGATMVAASEGFCRMKSDSASKTQLGDFGSFPPNPHVGRASNAEQTGQAKAP